MHQATHPASALVNLNRGEEPMMGKLTEADLDRAIGEQLQPWQREVLQALAAHSTQDRANVRTVAVIASSHQHGKSWVREQFLAAQRRETAQIVIDSDAWCRSAVAAADHDLDVAGLGDFSQFAAFTTELPRPTQAFSDPGTQIAARPDPSAAEIWLLERWFERAPRLMPLAVCVLILLLWGWAGSSDLEAARGELVADQLAAEASEVQP